MFIWISPVGGSMVRQFKQTTPIMTKRFTKLLKFKSKIQPNVDLQFFDEHDGGWWWFSRKVNEKLTKKIAVQSMKIGRRGKKNLHGTGRDRTSPAEMVTGLHTSSNSPIPAAGCGLSLTSPAQDGGSANRTALSEPCRIGSPVCY